MKIKSILLLLVLVFICFSVVEDASANVISDAFDGLNRFVINLVNSIAGKPVGKPPNTHFECVGGQCLLVDGDGVDECLDNSHCSIVNTCNDGTGFGSCVAENPPFYCYGSITGGELTSRCDVCGCPSGYLCGDSGVCSNDDGDTYGDDVPDSGNENGGDEGGDDVGDDDDDGDDIGDDEGSDDSGDDFYEEDSDADGLLDDWEMRYFNSLEYGWNDDPDGDGINNAEEYAAGTNPSISGKKSSNLIWMILGGVVGVALILFIILGFVKLSKKIKARKKKEGEKKLDEQKKKEEEGVQTTESKLSDEKRMQIKNYIEQANSRGFGKEQIKQSLLKVGWSESDLKEFFG